MANRRMFSLSVVDTDTFLEMPITSRLLYYELGMRTDDDGFVDNWKKIMKFAGLSEDDLKILIAKRFIIPFESGVIVIRHWRLNNYLRNDRYTPTLYKKELAQLQINDNIYELKSTEKSTLLPDGIPTGIPMVSTGKDRIGKDRIGESKEESTRFKKPSLEEVQNYVNEKNLNVNAKSFYDYFEAGNWIDSKGNKVKSWKQKLLTWNNHAKDKPQETKYHYEIDIDYEQFYTNFEEG